MGKASIKAHKVAASAREALELKILAPATQRSPSLLSVLGKLSTELTEIEDQLQALKLGGEQYKNSQDVLKKIKTDFDYHSKRVAKLEISTIPLGDERPVDAAEEEMALDVARCQQEFDAWKSFASEQKTPVA